MRTASAEDIPELLEELDPDPGAPVWNELWSRVCHQGSTFSASVPVLPFLLSAAAGWKPRDRGMALTLAGAIVAAPESVIAGHEVTIEALRLLALESLKSSEVNRRDRVYLMQAALALAGDRVWGRCLDSFNDGELSASCPLCGVQLFAVIGDDGFFCAVEDWTRDPEAPRIAIQPLAAGELAGVGQWLYAIALESCDGTLSERICHLFGRSTCPGCHRQLDIPTAIAGFYR